MEGNPPNNGELPAGGATPAEGAGGSFVPPLPSTLFPGSIAPMPGMTPAPSTIPSTTGSNAAASAQGSPAAAPTPPVTFTLPGGYGNPSSTSFTLGEGRLAKPPITFSATLSEGYDTNIFNADAHPQPTPTPIPLPTPPLQYRVIGFHIAPPNPPTAILQPFRPAAAATPTPGPKPLGVIGSPVTSASVGVQVQHGTRRTIFTLDLSVGEQIYANEPGNGTDYNGSFDLAIVHRISPRATLSLEATAVYQNTPNFALINAPTNNNTGGDYLNGDLKATLSYTWGSRLSTITSGQINFNLLNTAAGNNLYQLTYGNQFRYTVSPRDTASAEVRIQQTIYPSNAPANNSALYYLLGLDTIFSPRLSNHIDGGLEVVIYPGGASQNIPYLETATTLALPRQAVVSWTNEYGSQATGSADVNATSYRTGLSLSQAFSSKLVASLSVAYNYVVSKGTSNPAGDYTQNQLQSSVSVSYTFNPRLSASLTYTYIDFLTTQLNNSYLRQQIYLAGTYVFK
jgi:hypothetical protein